MKFIFIFIDCVDGFYNKSCSIKCGICKVKVVCDKNNGLCLDGCDGLVYFFLCKSKSLLFYYICILYF